jgi:hypothetical protein
MNAQVRGGGHVGELTQNIARAFDEAERCQQQEQIPAQRLIPYAVELAINDEGAPLSIKYLHQACEHIYPTPENLRNDAEETPDLSPQEKYVRN